MLSFQRIVSSFISLHLLVHIKLLRCNNFRIVRIQFLKRCLYDINVLYSDHKSDVGAHLA